MNRVFLLGTSGAAGSEIKRYLVDQRIDFLDGNSRAPLEETWSFATDNRCDVVVTCLPMEVTKKIFETSIAIDSRFKIIDASSHFRTNTSWVYGMKEFNLNAMKNSRLISNPGCFAQGVVSILKPLMVNGFLKNGVVPIISSMGGVSAGGKNMVRRYSEEDTSMLGVYGINKTHRHEIEIKHQLEMEIPPFTPMIGGHLRGMLVSITLEKGKMGCSLSDIENIYARYFPDANVFIGSDHVSPVCTGEEDPMFMELHLNDLKTHFCLTSKFDNLGRGSAGRIVDTIKTIWS